MKALSDNSTIRQFRAGVIACIPTLFGYWAIGFACGAIGRISGFSTLEIALLAIFVYAGSSQFLFYQLAAMGAGVMQIAIAVAFINMRYLLINTYMAQFFSRATVMEKLVGSLLMTDETFGVASQYARKNNNQLPFYWLLGLNLVAWWSWIFATIVGSIFAAALPLWLRDSLAFSLVGMFIGLLILGWYASRTRILDLIVMATAILIILLTHDSISPNFTVIIATLIAATVGAGILMWRSKRVEQQ